MGAQFELEIPKSPVLLAKSCPVPLHPGKTLLCFHFGAAELSFGIFQGNTDNLKFEERHHSSKDVFFGGDFLYPSLCTPGNIPGVPVEDSVMVLVSWDGEGGGGSMILLS